MSSNNRSGFSPSAKLTSLLSWLLLHHQVVARGKLTGAMSIDGRRGQQFWF